MGRSQRDRRDDPLRTLRARWIAFARGVDIAIGLRQEPFRVLRFGDSAAVSFAENTVSNPREGLIAQVGEEAGKPAEHGDATPRCGELTQDREDGA